MIYAGKLFLFFNVIKSRGQKKVVNTVKVFWLLIIAFLLLLSYLSCQHNPLELVSVTGVKPGDGDLSFNISQPQNESIVRDNPITVSGYVPAGMAVFVNGLGAKVENSRFSLQIVLEEGPNMIEVKAITDSGQEITRYINIIYVP